MVGVALTRKPLTVLICSLVILLMLMSYQVADPVTGRTVLGNVLFRMFTPFQIVVSATVRGVIGAFQTYFDLVGANKENEQLKQEVTELKIKLAATTHEKEENARLRKVLQLDEEFSLKLIAGEVIAGDAKAPVSSTLTVNRGFPHGIRTEMGVVTPVGAVGMTVLVTSRATKVQLITDPSSAVATMLQRNGVSGILEGSGGGLCRLRFLPVITEIRKGDVVVTSGLDGIFPEGIPVGKVLREISEGEYYKSAEVMPFQNFSSLQEVVFLSQTLNPTPIQDK